MMAKIRSNPEKSFRLEQADRGRGALNHHMCNVNLTVRRELTRRGVEEWS